MTPSSSSNVQAAESEQATEPVTTSAPQSPEIQTEESEIAKISFCDVDDLNSHYNNQNLRFNCSKKACTGQF